MYDMTSLRRNTRSSSSPQSSSSPSTRQGIRNTNNNTNTNTNNTTHSPNNNNNNGWWWTGCNSAGAREAMMTLSQSRDIRSMIPGPFVVMQGTPGDGMANTIDSMPEFQLDMNIDSGQGRGPGSGRGRNATASTIGAEAGASILAAAETRGGVGSGAGSGGADGGGESSSSISIPSDLPIEIPHLSSASGSGNSGASASVSASADVSSNIIGHTGDGNGNGDGDAHRIERGNQDSNINNTIANANNVGIRIIDGVQIGGPGAEALTASDGEIVCLADSMASDISSLEVLHADTVNNSNSNSSDNDDYNNDDDDDDSNINNTPSSEMGTPRVSNVVVDSHMYHQNRTQMDRGGLHLPLPASAVSVAAMSLGYNSFLPPVAATTTATGARGTATNPQLQPQPQPQSKQQQHQHQHQHQIGSSSPNRSVLRRTNTPILNNTTSNYKNNPNQHQHSNHPGPVLSDSFVLVDEKDDKEMFVPATIPTNTTSAAEVAVESSIETSSDGDGDGASSLQSNRSSSLNNMYKNNNNNTNNRNVDIGTSTSCNNNPRYANMPPSDRRAIRQWKNSCREQERHRWKEMMEDANTYTNTNWNGSISASTSAADMWWTTQNGCLAVFESLPVLSAGSGTVAAAAGLNAGTNTATGRNIALTMLGNQIATGNIIAELPPGTTVMATELHCIDEDLIESSGSSICSSNSLEQLATNVTATTTTTTRQPSAFASKYQMLKIESPRTGYIVYSTNGYSYLGPGLPSYYVEPELWMWRVMCSNGAFVRQGLELTSVHTETISYGSFVRVTRKTVNSMGLSRLQIESSLPSASGSANVSLPSKHLASILRNRNRMKQSPSTSSEPSSRHSENEFRRISGWISEALNPLSGQRGAIVQSIPFPVPALYRVTLTDGAVIRSGVELSSPQIGHAPIGSILTIVGRTYSEHPADRCLERLKLAGMGGWISVRLNRAPPRDYLVVEMIGIDGTFDPNEAGLYHIEKQREVIHECHTAPSDATTQNMENLRQSLHRLSTISSINDDDEDQCGNLANSGDFSNNTCSSLTSAAVPTLYRSGVASGSVGSQSIKGCGSKSQKDEHCLICLTESRTATIVHGETGHIACCLTCARILKARGDKCPVCRLPIDSIIQQFWA